MLGKEMLVAQFGYSRWANERVLEKAAELGSEEWNEPSVVGERSLGQILGHMVRVEKVWRLLAQSGQVDPERLPSDEMLSNVKAVRHLLEEEQSVMESFISGLGEDDLAEEMTITRWDGIKVVMNRWQMLVHLQLHSMQHRSEAAVLLTNYGHSPGDIDFLFYALAN